MLWTLAGNSTAYEYPQFLCLPLQVFATAGNMLFIDMTHELDEDTLENFGDRPCNASMNIYYDECVYSSISSTLMSEFGCVVPWLPPNTARPVCRFDNSTDGAAKKTAVMNRFLH